MLAWRFLVVPVLIIAAGLYIGLPERGVLNDLSIYDKADWWNDESPFAILARMNQVRVPYFIRKFELAEGGAREIADLGCGGGLVTEAIALAGYEVTGFDISEPSLQKAAEHAAKFVRTPVRLSYKVGSIYEVPLPDSSVDGVIVSDVLEHLHEVPAALGEVFRILRPGGVLVFDTAARTWWSWLSAYFVAQEILGLVEPGAHDWNLFINPDELVTMLTDAGFKTDLSTWAGIVSNLNLFAAISDRSIFSLVESFREDPNDFSLSYMGYAVKPVAQSVGEEEEESLSSVAAPATTEFGGRSHENGEVVNA